MRKILRYISDWQYIDSKLNQNSKSFLIGLGKISYLFNLDCCRMGVLRKCGVKKNKYEIVDTHKYSFGV